MDIPIDVMENEITVPYTELAGSPQVTVGSTFRGTRTLRCEWPYATKLAFEIRGIPVRSGSKRRFMLPQRHPLCDVLFAADVNIQPFGGQTAKSLPADAEKRFATYQYAELQVTYAVPEWEYVIPAQTVADRQQQVQQTTKVDALRMMTSERLEGSVEFITAPAKDYYWYDPPGEQAAEAFISTEAFGSLGLIPAILKKANLEESPGRTVRMLRWTYKYHNVLEVPEQLLDYMNCVNKEPVRSPRFRRTFPAGTVLYTAPLVEPKASPDGSPYFDISLNLSVKMTDWNKFFRPDKVEPEYLVRKEAIAGMDNRYVPFMPYTPEDFSSFLPTPEPSTEAAAA
jgi:hypothetical protein